MFILCQHVRDLIYTILSNFKLWFIYFNKQIVGKQIFYGQNSDDLSEPETVRVNNVQRKFISLSNDVRHVATRHISANGCIAELT